MMIDGVTIVVRVHNGMPHLPSAVRSALQQTYEKLEVLVIDDGSQDGTSAYLDTIKDTRLRVIHQKNKGPAAAGNRGLREAKYNWIAILDADDLAAPDRIERQVSFLEKNSLYTCVGSSVGYVGQNDQPYVAHIMGRSFIPSNRPRMLNPPEVDIQVNAISHSSALYDRRIALAIGGYREYLPVAEDFDFFLRLSERCRIACVAETLTYLRILPDSLTARHMLVMVAVNNYARTCAAARRIGQPEPDFKEFMNSFTSSAEERHNLRTSSHYRMLWAYMTSGHYLWASYHLGCYATCDLVGFLRMIKSAFKKLLVFP